MNRLRPVLGALCLSLGALVATSALAATDATPFGAFQSICLTPNADFATVKAAVASWRDTEVTGDTTLPGVTVSDKLTKASKTGGIPVTLFAWTGTTKSGVHVSGCTLRVSKPDFDELQGAATAYAGFAAQDASPKKAVFHYTSASGKLTALDKSGFEAAASGEGMDILTVSSDIHGSVVDLLKIKK